MLIFSEVLTMKHTFKTLLVLVLVVFVLAGCSNPAGPETPEVNEPPVIETPEVNEPPVIETPEENVKLVKVEFKWSTEPDIGSTLGGLKTVSPRYLLGLRFDSENNLVYDYPKGYDKDSYKEFTKTVDWDNFYKDALEEVFITKYYEEGEIINLTQWTSEATDLRTSKNSRLCFLTEDIERNNINVEDFFDKVVVGNEDIVIYVYWKLY